VSKKTAEPKKTEEPQAKRQKAAVAKIWKAYKARQNEGDQGTSNAAANKRTNNAPARPAKRQQVAIPEELTVVMKQLGLLDPTTNSVPKAVATWINKHHSAYEKVPNATTVGSGKSKTKEVIATSKPILPYFDIADDPYFIQV
jgi:hypothetical protein